MNLFRTTWIPRFHPLRMALAASMLPACVAAQAQFVNVAVSPTPALAGQPLTITFSTSGTIQLLSISGLGVTINNPKLVNGSTSITVPPMPAGFYQIALTFAFGGGQFPQVQHDQIQVFEKDAGDAPGLRGQYVFQLSGQAAGGQAGSKVVAGAGSFTADGKGNVTAGVIDINSPAGSFAGVPVTGTYQLNAYGLGTVNLVSSQGIFQFSLDGPQLFPSVSEEYGSVLPNTVPEVNTLSNAVLTTTAEGLASASGTLVQIDAPAPASYNCSPQPAGCLSPSGVHATLNNGFFAELTGDLPFTGVPFSSSAQFVFSPKGTLTSSAAIAANSAFSRYAGWTGTYTPFDATTGRSVLTLTNPSQPEETEVFAVYQLPYDSTLYLVSTTSAPGGLVVGRANPQ